MALFVKVSDSLVSVVKKIVESFQFVEIQFLVIQKICKYFTALLGIFAAFKLLV